MAAVLDTETLEQFRTLPPRQAYERARDTVYRLGATSSADFLDVCEQLVAHGILTWEQIEEFDNPRV